MGDCCRLPLLFLVTRVSIAPDRLSGSIRIPCGRQPWLQVCQQLHVRRKFLISSISLSSSTNAWYVGSIRLVLPLISPLPRIYHRGGRSEVRCSAEPRHTLLAPCLTDVRILGYRCRFGRKHRLVIDSQELVDYLAVAV